MIVKSATFEVNVASHTFSGNAWRPILWHRARLPVVRKKAVVKTVSVSKVVNYHVVEGAGYSVVGGERLDWEDKDVFTVPTWTVLRARQ